MYCEVIVKAAIVLLIDISALFHLLLPFFRFLNLFIQFWRATFSCSACFACSASFLFHQTFGSLMMFPHIHYNRHFKFCTICFGFYSCFTHKNMHLQKRLTFGVHIICVWFYFFFRNTFFYAILFCLMK